MVKPGKNIYFSTYPPPTLTHLSNHFTSASKPAVQKSFDCCLSHLHTSVLTSSSSAKHWPPSRFFSGPNRWKSLGAKSTLWGKCSRSSHCISWNLPWVAWAVWGLALSWWSCTPLASWPGCFQQIASRSFNRTSQHSYDAEFTFSPSFWKWATSTHWESQNTVSITFQAGGII
jgi:hypothetical protein